ncbi:MAG: 30S ribosomal protein S7 [Nitrospinae bacterium RIFCSPLOWO2_12_FULL_45_22]|nr:MAG: 30S ribosomal protein S7 [Nitrospinae bacterium RIFCSPLOWO2_12_FULL_45_22]
MARRRVAGKRIVLPDPKYHDVLVAKCINAIMKKGKKSLAETILYRALEIAEKKTGDDPLKVFKKAIENVKPVLEVKSRRVGGATYQIPVEVRSDRRITVSLRWIIDAARKRSEKTMQECLAAELIDAYKNTGTAIKKKDDTHRMAEANKAFAHYRW